MEPGEAAAGELVGGGGIAEEAFEIGGGKLDQGLKEMSLLGLVPDSVPEAFEDFVAFPPVGEVVQIDPIQIVFRLLPVLRRKRRWLGFRLSVGMSARRSSRVRVLAWNEAIGWERAG